MTTVHHHLLLNTARASALRAVIRAVLILATAFGFDLSVEQVAAIQLVAEAVLQAARSFVGEPDT